MGSIDQFERPFPFEIVRERLREICPPKKLEQMNSDEIEKATHVAFEIIGYKPKSLLKSIKRAYDISSAEFICDFIFDVWRCDNDGV